MPHYRKLLESIIARRRGLSLLEAAEQLGTERVDRVVAPFRERRVSVKRTVLLGAVLAWSFAWTKGHQPVLVAEATAVLPIAGSFFVLSLLWLVWLRATSRNDSTLLDVCGTVANFAGLGVLLTLAPILLTSLAALLPLMCIAIGARYGTLAFHGSLVLTVFIVALIPPPGYWMSRPAYAVYALALVVGVPLAVSRVLTALREISEQAVESRNSQKRFLATMSHELRTPLNALLNSAALIDTKELSPNNNALFESILQTSGALLNRVQEVLDTVAVDEQRLALAAKPFSLRAVLDVVGAVASPQAARKGVSLTIAHGDDRRRFVGDAGRIEQVLTNLVSNAIQFTPSGGTVSLTHKMQRETSGLLRATFSISDTGCGVINAEKSKIFDPFFQSKSNTGDHGGVGLGLSIAKAIVHQMGGTIAVEDTPGGGATFSFSVPLPQAEDDGSESNGVSAGDAIDWHKRNVPSMNCLVIDDNGANRQVTSLILSAAGHTIEAAPDGTTGLSLLRTKPFDVAFLDIHMPDISGWDVFEQIRTNPGLSTNVRVVLLTAVNDVESIDRAARLGVTTFLAKPIYPQTLLECVKTLSGSRGVSTSSPEQPPRRSALSEFRSIASPEIYQLHVFNLIAEINEDMGNLRVALANASASILSETLHRLINSFSNADSPAAAALCVKMKSELTPWSSFAEHAQELDLLATKVEQTLRSKAP